MNCLQVKARLAAYVSGDLSAGDAVAIEAHLEGCTLCRSEAAAFERCEEALGVLGAVEEPPDLSEDLRRRIAAPLPRRPRWGVAAAVAGAAVALTAIVVLLLGPRKAPPPGPPILREDATQPAVVSMPQLPDAAAEIPAETPVPAQSVPVRVSAPRRVPAEVIPEQAASPALVSVSDTGAEPTGLEEGAMMEAAPAMASLTTRPERAGGVVLLLGKPKPVEHASSCYLEVSLPNGARSVFERIATLEPAGAPRVIQISYEQIAPQPKAQDGGG
jgi:anti-sigma factor RsiW